MGRVLSAVDIGSNTVHLLVGELGDRSIKKLHDESDWLMLGEIVAREKQVPKAAQSQLLATLSQFKKVSKDAKSEGMYVFATEAIRKASNSKEVLQKVLQETGLQVEIVSGRREAEFALKGVLLDTDRAGSVLLVDVGGGSAQLALCHHGRIADEASLPLGTGTLIAKLGLTHPCDYVHVKRIERAVDETLGEIDIIDQPDGIVACGGVARGLVRALHPDGDRELRLEELHYLIWATQRLAPEAIKARFHVKAGRATTLLPGAIVFSKVMERASKGAITVSAYGVREGAIGEMAGGKVPVCPI